MTEEPDISQEEQGKHKITREEIKLTGAELVEKVKELIHQGNIRRIVIKQEGRTVMELPLTVAAVGVVFAPVLAAVGAFAALVSNCSIVVERIEEE
ncbi:MAG: DUF4342 domain-containing protein [Chloroflexi bacterium]|nr:DUF4342 domain-containing protein [Chloroflexota bacterium]